MKKIKVYLDTNTIVDFFINQAKSLREKESFRMPKKLEFFIDNLDKLEFVTSFLTKTEVMRELVAGHGIKKNEVENMWNDFLKLLSCDYVKSFSFDENLVNIAGDLKLKLRTLMNFQHLFIAMSIDSHIVTGDKDLIKKVRQNKIYDNVLSYVELRELISSPSFQDS